MWGKKKTKLTLKEQQDEAREHLAIAVANEDFPRQEALFEKLILIDKKIKKGKQ